MTAWLGLGLLAFAWLAASACGALAAVWTVRAWARMGDRDTWRADDPYTDCECGRDHCCGEYLCCGCPADPKFADDDEIHEEKRPSLPEE